MKQGKFCPIIDMPKISTTVQGLQQAIFPPVKPTRVGPVTKPRPGMYSGGIGVSPSGDFYILQGNEGSGSVLPDRLGRPVNIGNYNTGSTTYEPRTAYSGRPTPSFVPSYTNPVQLARARLRASQPRSAATMQAEADRLAGRGAFSPGFSGSAFSPTDFDVAAGMSGMGPVNYPAWIPGEWPLAQLRNLRLTREQMPAAVAARDRWFRTSGRHEALSPQYEANLALINSLLSGGGSPSEIGSAWQNFRQSEPRYIKRPGSFGFHNLSALGNILAGAGVL